METKTLFGILGVLLVVGVFGSMLSGTAMPVFPSLSLTAHTGSAVCVSTDVWSGIWCFASGAVGLIQSVFAVLTDLAFYISGLALFFTGVSAIINGMGIPEPLGFMIGVFVVLAWILVVADIVKRVRNMFW